MSTTTRPTAVAVPSLPDAEEPVRDLNAELDSHDDARARFIKLDVDEKLVGVVVKITERRGKFGVEQFATIAIDDADETVNLSLSTVLAREFADQQIQAGDRVGVKRLSDLPGKAYKRFKVLVEHDAVPF